MTKYIDPKAVKHILVVRNDRFGEFLLNMPALGALKETFPDAKISAVVSAHVGELAQAVPFIDEIIVWNQGRHSFFSKSRLIRFLRKKRIDLAVIFNPSKSFNFFTYLSGIPIRVGYNRKWGRLLTHKLEDEKYKGTKHEAEYNLELVGLAGAKTKNKTFALPVNTGIIDNLFNEFHIAKDDKLAAIHPWTSDPIKQWPFENFRELAERISASTDTKVLIIGGKEEKQKNPALFTGLGERVFDFTGRTNLKELAALLKRCCLLISGDSGPAHLAGAVNTKAVVIFRNDIPAKSPVRWKPLGQGHIIIEKNHLCDISAGEVFETARKLLSS